MPYTSVRNQTWTTDEFYSLTKDLYIDKNGDGQRNNADVYGFAGIWDANGSAMLQAADIYVVRKDEDDNFVIAMEGDRLTDFYNDLYTWSKDESTYLWSFGSRMDESKTISFLDNTTYFTQEGLDTRYLSADFDVGILPLPKYDTEQDNYRHVNWGNNIIVPKTIKHAEMVSDVLEMMAYYTRTVVQASYYDTVLQYRVSNSPDDREMVELIFNTVVYDPGIAYCDKTEGLSTLVYLAGLSIIQDKANIASILKANGRTAQKNLDKLMDKVRKRA